MQCFPVGACCLLLFVGLVVAVGLAVEKEAFSCRRRDEIVSATVDGMLKNPATCQAAARNLMELDVTTVVWRAGGIAAFVLACVAALLAGCCRSIWLVFFGVFFTSLCVAYLRAGHERAHVSGPIYAGLRVAARLQAGDRPEEVAPRQL
jgi:hypothetical protein